ncbi:hypothetical protein WUBG_10852 [Wuchereria bancrofti]|uniref:Uncharacterized protein n=1 Tax=Wuchereria bancrofti TaxID=6293 RepID=J9ESJ5_WUCBA|nr:hypothetical protein WUBG_10852 [Wuchereria bancrofti]
MLRIYISAIILLAIEYASLANTSTNITAWVKLGIQDIFCINVVVQEKNSSKIVTVALFDRINKSGNYPSVTNLSQDWKIVNSHGITIPLNRIEVINSYPLNVISTATIKRKIKRQTGMSNDKMIKRMDIRLLPERKRVIIDI